LVIGYGNTLHCDDGVGCRVAEQVEALKLPGVSAMSRPLLTPELAEPISRASCVVFVDASIDAPAEVRLRPLTPGESGQIMAHASDPRTLLALARDVFGCAPKAWWLTIPAENPEIGEKLSGSTRRGLVRAMDEIKNMALDKLNV
jgi:hydrogenase maturation protease